MKVFMYRRVVGNRNTAKRNRNAVHIDDFRRHLLLLRHWGYTTMTFRQYIRASDGREEFPDKPVIITFDAGYFDNYQYAYPLLHEYGMNAVIFILGDRRIDYNYWEDETELDPALLINDYQTKKLHQEGFEIGSHSMKYVDLTTLDPYVLKTEVEDAKRGIESLIDDSIYSFSYPYGRFDERTCQAVTQCGYHFGCSRQGGPSELNKVPLNIPRIKIYNTTGATPFGLRVLTPYQYFDWCKDQIRYSVSQALGVFKPPKEELKWQSDKPHPC